MKLLILSICALALAGCGGDVPSPFADAVYIQIEDGGSLSPVVSEARSGARVIFLNDDRVSHRVFWSFSNSMMPPIGVGKRGWLDLPPASIGTVFSFRLDDNGASGSITITP